MRRSSGIGVAGLAVAAIAAGAACGVDADAGPVARPPAGTAVATAQPASERDGRAVVRLCRGPGAPKRFVWSARPGSAVAGEDFEPRSGVVEFAPGGHERTVAVPVHADAAGEGTETLWVTFSAVRGGRRASAVVRLRDGG